MTQIIMFLLNCEFLISITLNLVNIVLIFGFECLKDSAHNSCSYLCFHIAAVILVRRVALTFSVVIGVIILKTQFYFIVRIVCLALLQM